MKFPSAVEQLSADFDERVLWQFAEFAYCGGFVAPEHSIFTKPPRRTKAVYCSKTYTVSTIELDS